MTITAVVFDLDATLVDLGGHVPWRQAHKEIKQHYLDQGCDPEKTEECSAKGLFPMLEEMWDIITIDQGETKATEAQEEAYDILCTYEEGARDRCVLMPGCMEALDWVKNRGLPMGVCTSNAQKAAEAVLDRFELSPYFDAVVGRSTSFRMKPSPEQLNECFRLIGADPRDGVMVGDSHKDVIAGKAVGAYTVAVPVYFSKRNLINEAGVDAVISSLHELPEALERLQSR